MFNNLLDVFGAFYLLRKRGKRKMKEFDKVNIVYGLIAAVGSALLGEYWFLFAGFLVMNVIDYITGWRKSRYLKTESSAVGARGVLKKVSYWTVIGIAFYISFGLANMGKTIGINLAFVQLFGWFTLATYMVNEIRSILENLVAMKIWVPPFLIKGLEITDKLIEGQVSAVMPETEEERNES